MLAVAACAPLMTGCAQSGPVATPHVSAGVKPLFASDADALAAATKAYAAYLQITDQLLNDTAADPDQLQTVATGEQLNADLKAVSQMREGGFRGTGATKFEDAKLQQYVPNDDIGTVAIYVCDDITGTDLLDSKGNSTLTSTRATRTRYEVIFDAVGEPKRLVVETKEKWGDLAC